MNLLTPYTNTSENARKYLTKRWRRRRAEPRAKYKEEMPCPTEGARDIASGCSGGRMTMTGIADERVVDKRHGTCTHPSRFSNGRQHWASAYLSTDPPLASAREDAIINHHGHSAPFRKWLRACVRFQGMEIRTSLRTLRKKAKAQPAQQGRYIVRIMHKTTRSGGNVRGRRRDHVRTGQPKSSGQIRTVSCEAESQVIV